MSDNQAILDLVEKIWKNHDTTNSNSLDKESYWNFFNEIIPIMEGKWGSLDFTKEAFEQIFSDVDKSQSGLAKKDQMQNLLNSARDRTKKLTGDEKSTKSSSIFGSNFVADDESLKSDQSPGSKTG